jgi:hypothetical protein
MRNEALLRRPVSVLTGMGGGVGAADETTGAVDPADEGAAAVRPACDGAGGGAGLAFAGGPA